MNVTIPKLRDYARSHLRWFGKSAFRLSAKSGHVIFFDPVRIPSSAGPADVILVTHPHPDHFDKRTIAGLRKPETLIVSPQSMARPGYEGISVGQTIRIDGVTVGAVPAYNLTSPFHRRSKRWVGYLVEVDGLRVYHAGDTDVIPEMKDLKPDIALLPVGGFFTMGCRGAASAAASLGAVLCVPMHYGRLIGGSGAGERFCRMVDPAGFLPVRDT
jgi:L-ascorbate metabolism protein UlaG (beta-lactamase superfamily)